MLFDETFTHHCEILPQGSENCQDNYKKCTTNPGHKGFIPVPDFISKFLDLTNDKYYADNEKEYIRLMIDSTVKVRVSYTSSRRPDIYPRSNLSYPCIHLRGSRLHNRCGTGYLPFHHIKTVEGEACPCHKCKESDSPAYTYWEVPVSTAAHVVFDKEESETAVIELFYDSESKEYVRYLYGVDVYGNYDQRYNTDYCVLKCVTHEADLVDTLNGLLEKKKLFKGLSTPTGILVSHPHGVSKMVSVGCVDQKCFLPDSDSLLDSLLQQNAEFNVCYPGDAENVIQRPAERVFFRTDKERLLPDIFTHTDFLFYRYGMHHSIEGNGFDIILITCLLDFMDDEAFLQNSMIPRRDFLSFIIGNKITEALLIGIDERDDISEVFLIHFQERIKNALVTQFGIEQKSISKEEMLIFVLERIEKVFDRRSSVETSMIDEDRFLFLILQRLETAFDKQSREKAMDKLFREKCVDKVSIFDFSKWNDVIHFLFMHSINFSFSTTVLILAGGTIAILPPKPVIKLKRHFFGEKSFWGTISPPSTLVFTEKNREVKTCIQSELVFCVPGEAEDKMEFKCFSSLSYSMPTCPGSSGARVCPQFCPSECETDNLFVHDHHFGYDGEQHLSGRKEEGQINLRDIKNGRIKIWI